MYDCNCLVCTRVKWTTVGPHKISSSRSKDLRLWMALREFLSLSRKKLCTRTVFHKTTSRILCNFRTFFLVIQNFFKIRTLNLFTYTAIPYRASTGPEQDFPCEVFHTGKNLFSLQGTPVFITRISL